MADLSDRKRSRSVSPVPIDSRVKARPRNGNDLAKRLQSRQLRNHALNELLQLSSNHELSYGVEDETVLAALVDIFFEAIGYNGEKPSLSTSRPALSPRNAWTDHVTPEAKDWASFCEKQLGQAKIGTEKLKIVEVVLAILRNLSFVASNHRLLAYSPDVLHVLTGSLYEGSSPNVGISEDTSINVNSFAISTHALQALVNLAPYLDVTGQKLLCEKLFLVIDSQDDFPAFPQPKSYGLVADGKFGFGSLWLAKRLDTREDVIADVSEETVLEFTQPYLVSVWGVFPALMKVFSDTTAPRLVMMMAVDLLQELLAHARTGVIGQLEQEKPNARSIMVNMPDVILHRLVELLYIPRLGSDSKDYVDPTICIVTRVNTLKLLLGYDATVDTDLRDRALDVLVPVLELDSPNFANKLVFSRRGRVNNRLFDAVLPILTTQAGRSEAPSLASQLLKELSKAENSEVVRSYIRARMIALASTDDKIAHLSLNFF